MLQLLLLRRPAGKCGFKKLAPAVLGNGLCVPICLPCLLCLPAA
jgi:hypothetical protein